MRWPAAQQQTPDYWTFLFMNSESLMTTVQMMA
jgi:hypothetical protein